MFFSLKSLEKLIDCRLWFLQHCSFLNLWSKVENVFFTSVLLSFWALVPLGLHKNINVCVCVRTKDSNESWPFICKWAFACMCACGRNEGRAWLQQMLVFCQNNLVGIFTSCTRPQLGYRWREEQGVWASGAVRWGWGGAKVKVEPRTPRGQNLAVGQRQPERQTHREREAGCFAWTQQLSQMIMFLITHCMSCVTNDNSLPLSFVF